MKQQLQTYMAEHQMSQRQVAAAINVSPSVISQYLKGTYRGSIQTIEQAIEGLLQRQKAKVVERRMRQRFVPTYAAERCLDAIHVAHVEGEISVITGAAGLGKTQALKHYAATNPDVILIEVEPSCSPKILLKVLCKELKVNDNGANHDLFERITHRIGEGALIMVDEAELLSTRSLEFLRRIHDKTQCGVVLAGMPRLLINLKGKYGELAQLYSRVGVHCDLGNELTQDDIEQLINESLGADKDVIQALSQSANGNARRLNKLMRGAVRIAELHNRPLDNEIIERYAEMLIN